MRQAVRRFGAQRIFQKEHVEVLLTGGMQVMNRLVPGISDVQMTMPVPTKIPGTFS